MRFLKQISALMIFCFLPFAKPTIAQDAGVEKLVRDNCAACHGLDGNSMKPLIPKLAGLQSRYLSKQLRDFVGGQRMSDRSVPCAVGLNEQEIDRLAGYFGDQQAVPGLVGDAALIALGRKIYESGIPERDVDDCQECHRAKGAGSGLYPRVGGQHAAYALKQMRAFATKARSNDKDEIMHDVAEKMSDEEMRAVAEYMMAM